MWLERSGEHAVQIFGAGRIKVFLRLFYWLFVAGYAALILANSDFSPGDDVIFLRTLQQGVPLLFNSADFPYFDGRVLGRFMPLDSIEYNLLLAFSDAPAVYLYFLVHAVQFLVFSLLLVKLLQQVTTNEWVIYLTPIALALLPGYASVWIGLQHNERDVAFFFLLFALSYLSYLEQKEWKRFVLVILCANAAIYFKETAFIAIGSFAAAHYLLATRTRDDHAGKHLDLALMASALAYPLLYAAMVLPHAEFSRMAGTTHDLPSFIKSILNGAAVYDPLILLFALPITLLRGLQILTGKTTAEPVYDALLFSSAMFVLSYFILNRVGSYYFVPAYVLAIPPVIYFLQKYLWRARPIRILFLVTGVLWLFNTLPAGVHQVTYLKYMPHNFNLMLDTVADHVRQRGSPGRTNIFLDGISPSDSGWTYFIFAEFLQYRGLRSDQFDLKSDLPRVVVDSTPIVRLGRVPTPFSAFGPGQPWAVQKGDLLIVSPHSNDRWRRVDNESYIKGLLKEHVLLFHTQSRYAFPMFTLKELGRYLLSIGASPGETFLSISRHRPTPERPDYYVFVRK